MNLKFAHLVAIQFGIFVGVVSCLLFLRFDYAKPRTATERATAAEPVSERDDQRADRLDHSAYPESAQLVPGQLAPVLSNEYSVEAVERYRAEATRLYYEQIAPRRNANLSAARNTIAAVAPSYTEVAQEPAVVATYDPEPQTVAYVEPTQVIAYPQAVGFSHGRRFANRCRPGPHSRAFGSNLHRRSDRGRTHVSVSRELCPPRSLGVVHRQNTGGPSCAPIQGFKHRGRR